MKQELTKLNGMKALILLLIHIGIGAAITSETDRITMSDGTELHVTVRGEGFPVLYLHGGPGSGSYWMEVFMGDSLESMVQMIYLDQRGVGRSGSPLEPDFSLERMILDFEEVREAFGFETWFTMGHSFGGILQTAYAAAHPEVNRGMIMVNASLNMPGSFRSSWCPKALEFLDSTEELPFCSDEATPLFDRWNELIGRLNNQDLMWKMGFEERKSMDRINQTYGDIEQWNPDFSNQFQSYEEYKYDYTRYTSELNMPVLFYFGKRDWMAGPEHYRMIEFPDLLLWPAETAHMPFLENSEDLLQAIRTFLMSH